jgi:hypothetical protein
MQKQKIVTHKLMTENHCGYFSANRSFKTDALRPSGWVQVAGSPSKADLYVCVEWDSKSVWVGYHWQGGYSYREEAGLESLFMADWIINAKMSEYDQRYADNFIHHDVIYRAIIKCQTLLDDVSKVTAQIKEQVTKILTECDEAPTDACTI